MPNCLWEFQDFISLPFTEKTRKVHKIFQQNSYFPSFDRTVTPHNPINLLSSSLFRSKHHKTCLLNLFLLSIEINEMRLLLRGSFYSREPKKINYWLFEERNLRVNHDWNFITWKFLNFKIDDEIVNEKFSFFTAIKKIVCYHKRTRINRWKEEKKLNRKKTFTYEREFTHQLN